MSLHHLFCNNEAIAQEASSPFLLKFDALDRDHLRALRLRVGEHVAIVDASQDYFEIEITAIEGDQVWGRIAQHLESPDALPPVDLVQGLAKGEKMDTVLRAATELGIASFFPTTMARSIVRLDGKKAEKRLDRFRSIARSASLQSGRTTIPSIEPFAPLVELCSRIDRRDVVLLFWEEAPLANTLARAFDTLASEATLDAVERFWLVVGPEGGITSEEVALLKATQAQVFELSLGPSILRTETAGIVASALVINELRERML